MGEENETEELIQKKGLTAPRLTPNDIDEVITGVTYTALPSRKCLICEITLKNGFTVRGEAACVSPENFDQEIGEKVSYQNARDKIWQLEGYLLQEKHQAGRPFPLAQNGLSFGGALVALKAGYKVAREGWNGKGMWLALQVPDEHSKMRKPYIYMCPADGELVPWLASQTDVLASDWMTID